MTLGKYNDVMNKIEVTEEMRSRILQNIAKEFEEKPADEGNDSFADPSVNMASANQANGNISDFKTGDLAQEDTSIVSKSSKINFYKFSRYAGVAAAALILLVGAAVIFAPKGRNALDGASMSEVAMEVAHEAAADLHHEAAEDVQRENELIKGSWVKYDSVQKLSRIADTEFTEIEYLNSISSETDYYLDGETTATIVYDVTGNQITVRETKLTGALETAGATAENEISELITIDGADVRLYGTEDGFDTAIWVRNDIEYTLESVEKISLDEMTELMNNICAFDY